MTLLKSPPPPFPHTQYTVSLPQKREVFASPRPPAPLCAELYLSVDADPAAVAELVKTRVALACGVLPLALRAVLLPFPFSEERHVVFVVEASRSSSSDVTLCWVCDAANRCRRERVIHGRGNSHTRKHVELKNAMHQPRHGSIHPGNV